MDTKLPLSGKRLYLDLKGCSKLDICSLEQNLSLLGATIENWFSSDVSFVITSEGKREDYNGKKNFCNDHANLPPTPLSTSPVTSNENALSEAIKTSNDKVSRGKLILTKAAESKHENCVSGVKVTERARQLKIGIVHVDKVRQFLDRKKDVLRSQRANHVALAASMQNAKDANSMTGGVTVRKLRGPCIKVEATSCRFRPLYAEFDVFPAITASGSPCDRRGNRGNAAARTQTLRPSESQPRSVLKDSLSACRTIADTTPESSVSLRRSTGGAAMRDTRYVPVPPRQMYCEICRCTYSDLKMHRRSKSHQEFINDDANFACIDKRIHDNRLDTVSMMARLRSRASAAAMSCNVVSATVPAAAYATAVLAEFGETVDSDPCSPVAMVTAMLGDASIPSPPSPVFASDIATNVDVVCNIAASAVSNGMTETINDLSHWNISEAVASNVIDEEMLEADAYCDSDVVQDDQVLLLDLKESSDVRLVRDPSSEDTVIYDDACILLSHVERSASSTAAVVACTDIIESDVKWQFLPPPTLSVAITSSENAGCDDLKYSNNAGSPPLLSPRFKAQLSTLPSSLFLTPSAAASRKVSVCNFDAAVDDEVRTAPCRTPRRDFGSDFTSPSPGRDSRTRKAKALAEDAMLARRLAFTTENYSPGSSLPKRRKNARKNSTRRTISEHVDNTSDCADFDPDEYYEKMLPHLDRFLRR